MDFGIPALASYMASIDTSQAMTTNAMRRGLDQVEQVGDAIVQMMNNALMPPGSESGSRVNMVV